MPKPTVYIETTVVSYLTARPSRDPALNASIILTRQWWDRARPAFDLFASELVADEASAGDADAAADRLAVLTNLPNLRISEQAEALAAALLAEMALPKNARRDALHLGIAAANGID